MSETTLKRIVLLLVGLLILYGAARLLSRGGSSGGGNDALADALQPWRADTAEAWTLTPPGGPPVALTRNGGWKVNGMPADSAAVQRLERALADARVVELVATSAANHDRLGVSADSAWQLQAKHGERTTTLLLGRSATQRIGNGYVRLPDGDATWEVSADLRGAAARPLADWRDRILARVDTAKIASIIVQRDTQRYTLQRSGATWQVLAQPARAGRTASPPAAPDSANLHNLLADLVRIEASNPAPDTATFGGKEQRAIVVLGTAGDTLAAVEFAGAEFTWRMRRAADPTLWEIASYRLDRLTPKREDISAKTSPTG
jgi:hypothetical protein